MVILLDLGFRTIIVMCALLELPKGRLPEPGDAASGGRETVSTRTEGRGPPNCVQ
jgi:hypothetical protein